LVHHFYRPLIFNDKQVVFTAVPAYKLHILNPETGDLDKSWDVDFPTLNSLPQNDRTAHEKAQDCLDDSDMLVLEKSKLVIGMERRDSANNNSEYALNAW
jgi:hypothetical protein